MILSSSPLQGIVKIGKLMIWTDMDISIIYWNIYIYKFINIYMYISIFPYLWISISVCLSISLCVYISISLYICIYPYVYISTNDLKVDRRHESYFCWIDLRKGNWISGPYLLMKLRCQGQYGDISIQKYGDRHIYIKIYRHIDIFIYKHAYIHIYI